MGWPNRKCKKSWRLNKVIIKCTPLSEVSHTVSRLSENIFVIQKLLHISRCVQQSLWSVCEDDNLSDISVHRWTSTVQSGEVTEYPSYPYAAVPSQFLICAQYPNLILASDVYKNIQ